MAESAAIRAKDPKQITADDVYKLLPGLTVEQTLVDEFGKLNTLPVSISGNEVGERYTLTGRKVSELMEEVSGNIFRMVDLETGFTQICPDYADVIKAKDDLSISAQFAVTVAFKVGPESRKVKAKNNDKTWIFKIPIFKPDPHGVVKLAKFKACYVSTYKNQNSEYAMSFENVKDTMEISIKHANLLAVKKICEMNRVFCAETTGIKYILTPLAGAIFAKTDIEFMATELKLGLIEVLNIVNSSCQSGGQYLSGSRTDCAAVAAICATTKLRTKNKHNEARSIISKTVKQYMTAKRDMEDDYFAIFSKYATAGVPAGYDAKTLLAMYNMAQDIKEMPA